MSKNRKRQTTTTMTGITNHAMTRIIRRCRIASGDVVLIKSGTPLTENQNIREFSKTIEQAGLHNVVVVIVDSLDDVRAINETEMNKQGWYRVKTLRKIVHAAPESPKDEAEQTETEAENGQE